MDGQAQTNMPPQLLRSWGHINRIFCLQNLPLNNGNYEDMRKFLKSMFWLHYDCLDMPGCLMEKRSLAYQVSTGYFRIFRCFEAYI